MDWITTSAILRELSDLSNQTAWCRFVDRFQAPLVRFVGRLGFAAEDSRDIVQDSLTAFAEALRAGRYDREKGRLHAWLFGIAYNHALRQRQRAGRRERWIVRGEGVDRALEQLPDEKHAADLWNTLWERFVIHQCFRQIRREFRSTSVRAFEMIVREGHSAAEAAAAVGITTRAAYNAKHRILTRMRELRLELEEVDGN